MKSWQQKAHNWIKYLQTHANSWWYNPAISFLAFIDNFVVVIPTDGLLISGSMLAPKRWFGRALFVSLGSSLGAWILVFLIRTHGMAFVLHIIPDLESSSTWIWTESFMLDYGLWVVFAVAASPLLQHPALALVALTDIKVLYIFTAILSGRLLKYIVYSWVASHAPHFVGKLWGTQKELHKLEEVMKDNDYAI